MKILDLKNLKKPTLKWIKMLNKTNQIYLKMLRLKRKKMLKIKIFKKKWEKLMLKKRKKTTN